jgi:transposase InsO family protein
MRFTSIRQAKDEVLDWLLWYNQTHMHSTLNCVSPMQFELHWQRSFAAIAS